MAQINADEDGSWHFLCPSAFSVKASLEDIPNWNEALNSEDSARFHQVMEAKAETLKEMDHWEVIPCSEADDMNILDGLWVFDTKDVLMGWFESQRHNFVSKETNRFHKLILLVTHMHQLSHGQL